MLLATRPRRSTSATSYSDDAAAKIQQELDQLRPDSTIGSASAYRRLTTIKNLIQLLQTDGQGNHVRDAFRHLQGFEVALDFFSATARAVRIEDDGDSAKIIFEVLVLTLSLLTCALHRHWGNARYFKKKARGGGWILLTNVLIDILHAEHDSSLSLTLIDVLLACALGQDAPVTFFRSTRSAERTVQPSHIANPEALTALFDMWCTAVRRQGISSSFTECFPELLRKICMSSIHNRQAVHSSGLLSILLRQLDSSYAEPYQEHLQETAIVLLRLGVCSASDAAYLCEKARTSELVASIWNHLIVSEPDPPYIHFDLSLESHSSIELPDLRKTFPPASSSPGYTLSLWLQIVSYDPEAHTTLFGAFDASQSCFLLVYIERETQNLILQTSISSQSPSARFKAFTFETSRWYHLCIVHRRPKLNASARASLYVDGDFVEQVKLRFPDSPPTVGDGHALDRARSGAPKTSPVQVFVGTPADLAPHKITPLAASQWRIASIHLFATTLSDDLVAVHKELGPRYFGNYQDCLGSFQTYEASAALNLRNETLHPGREEASDIVAAIRSKASSLLPESQILLSFSPYAIIEDTETRGFEDSQLAHSLSRTAQRNLRLLSRGGRTAILINGSCPSIGTSLSTGSGVAILTGSPTVVRSMPLDKAVFSLQGAIPIGLSLLESSTSSQAIVKALETLFGLIKFNWRNSEVMERENGYGILAMLLDAKLRKYCSLDTASMSTVLEGHRNDGQPEFDLSEKLLEAILEFVGYRKTAPENSVINNPLAYRVLLVDLDAWRCAKPNVQRLYYTQFTVFIRGSKHHIFNAKRLARMRIVKKWLDTLKSEPFTSESLAMFVDAFRDLFSVAPATDSMRTLALYIAYALETPNRGAAPTLRHSRSAKLLSGPTGAETFARRATTPIGGEATGAVQIKGLEFLDSRKLAIAMLEMYADVICGHDASAARKFARAVSSKWMLNLLSYEDDQVTFLATKIIARTLFANGPSYLEKFCASKTCGPVIIRNALRRKQIPSKIWFILFAMFFGRDVAKLDLKSPFDLPHLLLTFPASGLKTFNAEFLPTLVGAVQQSLGSAVHKVSDAEKLPMDGVNSSGRLSPPHSAHLEARQSNGKISKDTESFESLLAKEADFETVMRFLSTVHQQSHAFRNFALNSSFTQDLIFMLYPFVVSSDVVSASTELHSRDSALTFNGEDVVIRPVSRHADGASIVRTVPVESAEEPKQPKARPLRRTSSYVLITSFESADDAVTPQLSAPFSPTRDKQDVPERHNQMIEEVMELIVAVYIDHLLTRKEFAGIGLYKRLPPGFQEHQAYFASYVLRNTLSQLGNAIRLKQEHLCEPRVLTNLSRFAMHLREAVYEGWFIGGAEPSLEFLGSILEHLQKPEIAQVKAVRLCSEIIGSIRWVVERIVLLRMSEIDTSVKHEQTNSLLQKITYWHNVIFFGNVSQPQFLKLFFYLLYTKVVSSDSTVAENATNLWRILLVQQPQWRDVAQSMVGEDRSKLSGLFDKILELDNKSFLEWLHGAREAIDAVVSKQPAELWEDFVKVENRRTTESAKDRLQKRRERLRQWAANDTQIEDVIRRHEQSASPWRANIFRQEHGKRMRSIQDEQDNRTFNQACWSKMDAQLHRPHGLLDHSRSAQGWQLDRSEGPNRMRLRLLPDGEAHLNRSYQAKEAATKGKELSLDIKQALKARNAENTGTPTSARTPTGSSNFSQAVHKQAKQAETSMSQADDEFEMVEEMNDGTDGFEDKNRKVMRSLERGDRVEHVYNTARIVGLEAVEAILIIGKGYLYMIDNYFVRSDNEIVNVWNAPDDERDSYLQLISGHNAKANSQSKKPSEVTHETRHWRWNDVLSMSKRRFLFREVGIEIFFVDGQSFLLTMARPSSRDELHSKLLGKAQSTQGGLAGTQPENVWRLNLLRTPEDTPQTLGSRFTSVFNNNASNTATRRWMRGELSNFHYLMLVNTMAGRTFNDLTQYPVFPWVLADYSSEELDLSNPSTYRDLTKPMGCQTAQREAEFRERYKTFAEMGDGTTPPFHYGTHYSSAMIVTSYLIRLPPFVQSYLLLQGGVFDHPDRMFYSVEKAWTSASRDNMTDVRELTPEFFYLPEMFQNINEYDFGARQGAGGKIDSVALPPWAKGDPNIFVAKHREALESEYVSRNIHAWIDLVFGHKQTGESALEATNVFHHLSYRGAKNLDEIQDPVERLATIGIIHNFGQTPLQVFQRPHPQREDVRNRVPKRLDSLAESLTRLPFPVLEVPDRIASIHWDIRREKLVAASPRMVYMPPAFDKFVEWGFVDHGLRFYAADSGKLLAHFEHVHEEQINAVMFVDGRTLVTAGCDATVSVWNVIVGKNAVDLQLKSYLFGHRRPVNTMTASGAFSTLLTCDEGGTVLAWDLNRSDLVRVLVSRGPRIDAITINNVNGWIISASGPNINLYSLNGHLLLDQMISTETEDIVSYAVWYEGSNTEYCRRNIFFTGHRRGVANIWAVDIMGGRWVLEHVKRLGHGETSSVGGMHAASVASITSILPRDTKVYIGDDDGCLYEWDCIQHG